MKRIIIVLFLMLPALSWCQEDGSKEVPELVTDRPDQTESASIVPQFNLQIETGFVAEFDKTSEAKTTSFDYNSTLLRFGLHERLELRFGFSVLGLHTTYRSDQTKDRISGFGPLDVGAKVLLYKGDGRYVPDIAVMAHVLLPYVGRREFIPGKIIPSVRLNLQNAISDFLSLGCNLGIEYDSDNTNTIFFYTFVLGFTMSEKFGSFLETYAFISGETYPDHRVDAGVTYLVRPNLQLDLSGGVGITSVSPNGFISAGVSWRIPR